MTDASNDNSPNSNFKQCTKCKQILEISNFCKKKRSPDGLNYWCKECEKKYHREYKENNREKVKLQKKDWTARNKDRVNKRRRELAKTDSYREVRKKRNIRNYDHNRDVRLTWRKKNAEKFNKKCAEWRNAKYKSDDSYRVKVNLRNRLAATFKNHNAIKILHSAEYDVNYEEIFKHIGPRPEGNWHIDHIIPLRMFDFNFHSHVGAAFLPCNHQWLTKNDNSLKTGKLIINKTSYEILKKITSYIKENGDEQDIVAWYSKLATENIQRETLG